MGLDAGTDLCVRFQLLLGQFYVLRRIRHRVQSRPVAGLIARSGPPQATLEAGGRLVVGNASVEPAELAGQIY